MCIRDSFDAELGGVFRIDAANWRGLELLQIIDVVPLSVGTGAHMLAADGEGVLLAKGVGEIGLARRLPEDRQLLLLQIQLLAHHVIGLGILAVEHGASRGRSENGTLEGDIRLVEMCIRDRS